MNFTMHNPMAALLRETAMRSADYTVDQDGDIRSLKGNGMALVLFDYDNSGTIELCADKRINYLLAVAKLPIRYNAENKTWETAFGSVVQPSSYDSDVNWFPLHKLLAP